MQLLVNIDVADLASAERFYGAAFGWTPVRRFGADALELGGAQTPVFLLHKPPGSAAVDAARRDYARHWTPIHCDLTVADLDAALARAVAAGAVQEGVTREAAWGRIVQLADPFGHGWCLLQLRGRGYDEIATA